MKSQHHIILISGALCGFAIQDGHVWGGDFALYINQAKQIAEGASLEPIYEWNKTAIQAYTEEMVGIYDYVATLDPDKTIVGFKKPRVLWLFSGIRSINTDLVHFDKSIPNYLLIAKNGWLGAGRL
jgi:hypothetical protein